MNGFPQIVTYECISEIKNIIKESNKTKLIGYVEYIMGVDSEYYPSQEQHDQISDKICESILKEIMNQYK